MESCLYEPSSKLSQNTISTLQGLHTDLLFESLFSRLHIRPLFTWALVSAIFLGVSTALSLPKIPDDFWFLFLPLSISVFFVPFTVRFCLDRLIEWSPYVAEFVINPEQELDKFLIGKLPKAVKNHRFVCLGGIALAFLSVIVHNGLGFNLTEQRTLPVWCWGQVLFAVSAFFAGAALGYLFLFAQFVWRLGSSFSVRVETHAFGILRTGRLLAVCYFLVTITWAIYTFTAKWGETTAAEWGRLWMLMLLAVPSLFIIIGTFFALQYPLHLRMVQYKDSSLRDLNERHRNLLESAAELTNDRIATIEFLNSEIARTSSLPEWPFDWQSLAKVASASFIPILSAFITKIFDFLGSKI